jgi:hypothetical protein
MTTLPPGVTLQQIDGGPNYYSNNGFTYAANAGLDTTIPIGPWLDMLITQSDANRWHDLGWNFAYTLTNNSNISVAASNGISVLQFAGGLLPGSGAETVGLLTADEPSTFADGVTTPISTTPNSEQDGRYWALNDTWNFLYYQGLNPVNSSAQVLDTEVTTPNGTQRHINISSVDIYWFAGGKADAADGNQFATLYQGGLIYGLGQNMTPDQAERGSNYGDMVDIQRSFQTGHFPAPITQVIEDGGPFVQNTSASTYITPPELNWAVWSSLIHGARNIEYFNHTFGGPAQTDDNLANTFYQTVQPGQTISMYNQVKATDALVKQMTPELLSPVAMNYVSFAGPGYTYGQIDLTQGGLEATAHDYNGTFYIFADTRDSETQHNIGATFTLNDPNATSVTVVGENRTIAVVNEMFTDTFANASTVHIYQVNDGPGGPPPPPPPKPPAISSFSPNTNGMDTTNSIKLTGTAADGTVTVLDGTTTVGTVPVTNGAWTITENNAANGVHTFTATDTDANGISLASSAFSVTVNVPSPPPSTNLVVNGGFETGDFTGWTIGPYQPDQTIITTNSHFGTYAAALGPASGLGSLSQTLATTSGQHYTLDFWLANVSSGPDDFMIKWNGTAVAPEIVNEHAQGYTEYKFDLVATGATTALEFDYRQDPTQWRLDDISVTAGTATQGLAVIGTTGNDTLSNLAGTTSDLFTGNGGIDTFVFHGAAFGTETITDFVTGSNHDIIQFDKTVFANFKAVKAHAAQVGANTVITVDAHDSVTLLGVSLSHLQAADFHFV